MCFRADFAEIDEFVEFRSLHSFSTSYAFSLIDVTPSIDPLTSSPSLQVNPAFCAGESLVGEAESTGGMLQGLFLSKSDSILSFSPTRTFRPSFLFSASTDHSLAKSVSIVPVDDIARLHIGGLLLPSIKEQRLIAAPHPVNWVQVLDIFRKLYPNKKFYDNPETAPEAVRSYDSEPALKVLKELGRDGWVPLEEALEKTVEAVA